MHLVLCLEGLPLLPLDLGPARGVGVPLGIRLGCKRSRLFFSFGRGRGGSCPLAADAPFPRLRFRCLSPILTARSTTWEFERDIGVLPPRVILPWFPIFGSRIKEG